MRVLDHVLLIVYLSLDILGGIIMKKFIYSEAVVQIVFQKGGKAADRAAHLDHLLQNRVEAPVELWKWLGVESPRISGGVYFWDPDVRVLKLYWPLEAYRNGGKNHLADILAGVQNRGKSRIMGWCSPGGSYWIFCIAKLNPDWVETPKESKTVPEDSPSSEGIETIPDPEMGIETVIMEPEVPRKVFVPRTKRRPKKD